MSRLSQPQKVVEFLKEHPREKFTARQLAEQITSRDPDDYFEKKQNPRFGDDKAFFSQVAAEIGAHKESMIKNSSHVFYQDRPRPRQYWYDPDNTADISTISLPEEDESEEITSVSRDDLSEHDLYPILIDYLKSELGLYCQRIDEKRSANTNGSGGNQWLHPDVVAMQVLDKDWNELIRNCVKNGAGQRVRLWSFEVKKELKTSTVRQSFFQTVSNSSWANEGYLVTTLVANKSVEQELRMLSALHGIGVIILNPENPSESDMLLPARSRAEVDWQSVNRILEENKDFNNYIELVSTCYETGRVRAKDWNKIQ